jgi:putative dimethyl sulfoxide reductase chaperone
MNSTRTRAETWHAIGRLFLFEPDANALAQLSRDANFAATPSDDPHDLRVEYTRLFTLNIFPYASVFRDPEGFMNTETTARVQAKYDEADFELASDLPVGAPDHFGVELSFVAHLILSGCADAASEFVATELVPWTPIFLHAVEKNARHAFYRGLARETRRWLLEDSNLSAIGEWLDPRGDFDAALPVVGDDDLYSVVGFLISPARSGVFLSKQDLSDIGRHLELPTSFGDRGSMLASLFRAAGEFDRIGALLISLKAEINIWIERYSSDLHDYPIAEAALRPWLGRATATLHRLQEMERAAEPVH